MFDVFRSLPFILLTNSGNSFFSTRHKRSGWILRVLGAFLSLNGHTDSGQQVAHNYIQPNPKRTMSRKWTSTYSSSLPRLSQQWSPT